MKFFKFAIAGGLATAVHWCLTAWLVIGLGVPGVAASTFGFICSAGVNFFINAKFTFDTRGSLRGPAARFAVMAGSGLLCNALVLWLALHAGVSLWIAQPLATAVTLAWNFSISSLWVFKNRAN